jgi:hypothetical protein
MIVHGLISDGRNYTGNQPPRSVGSSASRLLTLGDGSHHGAEFSPHERTMIRLWIESGATYPGTYAALGTGIHTVEFPVETIERRCGECHERTDVKPYHGMSKGTLIQFGHREPPQAMVPGLRDFNIVIRLAYLKFGEAPPHQWFCNLTQPEKSLLLQPRWPRRPAGWACAAPCSPAATTRTTRRSWTPSPTPLPDSSSTDGSTCPAFAQPVLHPPDADLRHPARRSAAGRRNRCLRHRPSSTGAPCCHDRVRPNRLRRELKWGVGADGG